MPMFVPIIKTLGLDPAWFGARHHRPPRAQLSRPAARRTGQLIEKPPSTGMTAPVT